MNPEELEAKVNTIKRAAAARVERGIDTWRKLSSIQTLRDTLAEHASPGYSYCDLSERPVYQCDRCHDRGFVRSLVPLGHPDFGKALPCKCTIRKTTGSYLKQLPNQTFENYDRSRDSCGAFVAALDYAHGTSTPWILFAGGPGLGKTHLITAILRVRAEAGVLNRNYAMPDMLGWFKAAMGGQREQGEPDPVEARINELQAKPLLALDDLATEKRSDWADEVIYRVLDARYRAALPTIMATNISLTAYHPRLRDRMLDRSLVTVVLVSGPSYRTGEQYQ